MPLTQADEGDRRLDRCSHFFTLARSLFNTRKKVRYFQLTDDNFKHALPPHALMWPTMTNDRLQYTLGAYSSVQCLDMYSTPGSQDDIHHPAPLRGLRELLHQLSDLKRLELHLTPDTGILDGSLISPAYYNYDHVFPDSISPILTHLTIWGLEVESLDLERLFRQRSQVYDLTLYGVDFLEGSWESAIIAACVSEEGSLRRCVQA